ncbi:hypothetical protein DM02DRAFT_614709 [Periconia macrospinosa]|uniref:Uncharacterized protein n=1 Tax=Periconia macrospinosa TaxID=97972 RepID=A0A2V1DNS4_9PLEO|nr:hypothetical protein DM02DRAFT_614709 [Periconia macrospinosa]
MRGGDDDSENIFHAVGSICRFLGSQIASDRLAFTFICDVKDYTTAKRLLRPFDALPRLKECNIRIGNRRDGALRSLARSTSTAATTDNQTGNTEGMPFPFMKLPRELRIQILQQTDLGGFGKDLDIRDLGLMSKQTTRFKCCGNCTFTKSDCCCPLNFSAQSNSCTCRILPMELFLTNRQMGLDATEVLYSSNNFKFKGNLISFLNIFRGFRHHTLKSFRRISFDFYSTQTTQWMLNHSQYWIETISFIRDNFDVSKLQLSVITTDDSKECKWSNYSERTTVPLYNAYVAITRTVKQQLPHLRDFHVTLGVFFDLEAELERWVMGPDYDSQRGSANRNATGKKSNPVWDISHCKVPRWHKGLGDDD